MCGGLLHHKAQTSSQQHLPYGQLASRLAIAQQLFPKEACRGACCTSVAFDICANYGGYICMACSTEATNGCLHLHPSNGSNLTEP